MKFLKNMNLMKNHLCQKKLKKNKMKYKLVKKKKKSN